eukprot:scaffold49019_cov63-Phaeocystis_antarctica.AAC.2
MRIIVGHAGRHLLADWTPWAGYRLLDDTRHVVGRHVVGRRQRREGRTVRARQERGVLASREAVARTHRCYTPPVPQPTA